MHMYVLFQQVRRSIRPYFVGTRWHCVYNVITRIATQVIVCYSMGGYMMRNGWATFYLYTYGFLIFCAWKLNIVAVVLFGDVCFRAMSQSVYLSISSDSCSNHHLRKIVKTHHYLKIDYLSCRKTMHCALHLAAIAILVLPLPRTMPSDLDKQKTS